jgi:rubrerythrin
MFTLGEIIDLAVRIEKNGENVYRKAQKEVSDPTLSSMLEWLADDELEHEKWFTQFKNGMDETGEDPKLEEMAKAILGGVLGEQAFSLQDTDFSAMESVLSLLELSLEFEKDTVLFYEMLSAFIEDEQTLSQLKKIIEEENRHVQVLKDFIEGREVLPFNEK